ncbi:MAG: hypothetical protein U0930_04765 [Pirellulales bacterium]
MDLKPLWPLFTWREARNFGFYAQGQFYVYALCYPSGLPFYVGRGKKYRVCQHAEEVDRLPELQRSEKHRVLIDLANRNETEWYHFLALRESAEEAASIERNYVERWGIRRQGGLLVNRCIPDGETEAVDVEALEPVDTTMVGRDTNRRRRVHHPDILLGIGGFDKDFDCSICRGPVLVPDTLMAKIVQCPHCAHLFLPLNPGWRFPISASQSVNLSGSQ